MTGWSVATFVALMVLPWFSATEASHFRGGFMMFEPDPSNDLTMRFAFRMAFRRSYSYSYYCDQSIKDSGQLLGSGDYWNRECTNYTGNPLCYSTYVASTGFHCTDFSIVEDWSMGENNFTYTFPANVYNLWTVSYTSCCWISLTKGGNSDWILSTVVNLTRRADAGEINSSPITTNQAIVRLREGCAQSIRIPLEDPDGDLVRCRWSHYYESYQTRDSFPHATLDEATCTLTYHGGSGSAGTYAVALTLEDYPAGTTDFANAVPYSSVGLQFLVIINASHSGSCDSKPVFTGSTPQDGQCAEIQIGFAYTATVQVTHVDHSQQIVELTTSSPSGMYFSPLSRNGLVYSSSITWYPSQHQAGKQVFCFKAVDNSGIESDTRCGTILVGLSYTPHVIPGSQQPRYPTSRSGPGVFWSSIKFDRPIKKPRSASFIRLVLRSTGQLVFKVNALSSHVSIGYNQTVLYFAMPFAALSMTGSYAILIDPGAVVGLGCSYDGPPTPGVASTSQWGFYVFGICNRGYYLAPPAFNNCTDVNECSAHPRSRRSNGWPSWASSSSISPSSTYSAITPTPSSSISPTSASSSDYHIRLVNGPGRNAGRVEIFLDGAWGTICDDLWDIRDANVVCRMLNYSGAISAKQSAYYGVGSGIIWLDNVQCQGYESSITDCAHNGIGSHNCGHHEDAGVVCTTDQQQTNMSCDFDSGLCSGWSQSFNDIFDWTLYSGSTPSSSTGPSSGHGGSGYYMYIETSSPRVAGDKAKLELTVPVSESASCLTFYYHMYGADMGTLNVYNGNKIVFSKSGDQGNIWIQAKKTLDLQGNVIFEGVRGSSYESDIAIDDVSITNGSCPVCMVSLNQSFGRIEVNSDALLCKWTIGSAGISQAVAFVYIEHLLWSCSEFVRIFDGSGSEVFNRTGCSLFRNGTFQEIAFGEENNITVHFSLIYGNSYVKIQYGILKQGLDSALLLSDWNVTVLNSTSSSLLIEWEKLTTQLNDGVRLYIVLVRNINGSLLTSQVVPENTTAVQITGIESYTKYLIGVVGVDGVGQPYKSLELLTTTEEGVPSRAPQNMTLTNLDQTIGVLVQWISLSQSYANGRLLGYRVKYRESWSYFPYKSINTSTSQVILRNLRPGHRYEILVAAFTSKGEGPHSYGNITTNCGILLNQSLGQVDVTHMDYNYVLCNWRIGNGGIHQAIALASFQELRLSSCSEFVKISDGNGSVVFYHDGCSSSTPETLRYIPFGEANSITVQSYFGWSGSSVKLKYAILKQGLHSALPVAGWNVTVTNTAGTSLTVQWTHLEAELDRPVRLYITVVKSTDNIVLTVEIMTANATLVALYGLNPSTQYKVGLIAVDDVGQVHKGAEVVCSTTKVPCGYRPSLTRIVGGVIAPVNSWPWQVMLMRNEGQFCGGSLVDPLWVVTAAHCVDGESPSSITIRLGAHYRTIGTVGTEQDIDVVRIVQHENYEDPLGSSNDIAMLKLAKPAILGQGVGLVCLPNTSFALPLDDANKLCWITGWGTLSSGGVTPNELMQASLPLVSRQRCLAAYPGELDDSMLCAGLDEGGVDTCQGDSGGPLVCEFNGTWYLEGATSWGYGCAEAGNFGVYASVRHQQAWILGNMFGVAQPTTPTLSTAIPPSSALVWCNFESGLCPDWSQSSFDDFNWALGAGSTQSSLTGPSSGHGGSGWYFYIETSFPRMPGENAKLEVSVPGNGTASCLTFYYHMFGASIGTLNVFSGQAKIFSMSGSQGDMWIQVKKQIYLDGVVLFEGIAGPSYTGDLAIDDVSIIIGSCPVSCDFDSGLCSGWRQSSFDSFDWTLNSGSTSSSSTGPSSGHGGSGYYMYIETSSPRVAGDKAKLELTFPTTGSASCLTFYYHMYGANMGTLNVYNGNTLIFTKSGDQGNIWIQATMTLYLQGNVTFEGVTGSSFRSDIAIDDVSTTNGSCPELLECQNYMQLTNGSRHVTYDSRGGTLNCDYYITPGWYRFTGAAGTQMPESCADAPEYGCGTHAAGWLNGSHPDVADGAVTYQVCYHWSSLCCWRSNDILVRNCSGFYVYNLIQTPGCSYRYCGMYGNESIAQSTSSSAIIPTTSSSVFPSSASPSDYSIQLVNGAGINEGRVEIYINGNWGTICDDSWGLQDANVVCRMLNYSGAISAQCCARYGRGSGHIWLDDVRCQGNESSIADCPHRGIGSHNCGHSEDAGVVCATNQQQTSAITPVPTTSSSFSPPSSSSSSDPNSFHLTGWSGSFSSPNHPYNYENRHYCTWLITVTTGFYVRLTFSYFDLEHGASYCPYDYVEIFDGNSTSAPRIIKRCGYHAQWCVHSSSNNLFVRFLTDGSVVHSGFFAYYETVYNRSGICHSATAATTYVTPMTSTEHGIHPTPSSSFFASSSINVQPPAEDFVLHLPADCAQVCSNTPGSFVCSCYNGFQLGFDGKTCLDINECRINNGGCSHHCSNVPGSFYCECPEGVTMAADNRSCVEPGVTVTCSDNNMTVSMEQRTFPFISIHNLNLRDPSCQAYDNGTHFILTTALNGCGTTHNESQDALFFWNDVVANAVNIENLGITRSHNFRLPFYCQYSRQKLLSLSFTPRGIVGPIPEKGYGNLTFRVDLYRSSSFVVPYTQNEFPISVRLGEHWYLRYSVESGNADLVVMATNIVATKDGSSYSSPQYAIIENGCERDTTLYYPYDPTSSYQQLTMEAFRLFDNYDTFYIHLEVLACHAGSANSRCAQSCPPINGGRKRREALQDEQKESTDKVWISGGPLIIKDVGKESGDSGQSSGQAALIGGVGAAGGLFVLAVVALVVLAVKYRIARLFLSRNKVGDLYNSQDENMSRRNAYVEPEDMMEKEDVL